jgi:large conductance mechanosensitive channel
VNEVVDPSGEVIIAHGDEVALEWGAFVTVIIDFIIVAFVMFLIIKAINALKKKEQAEPTHLSKTDELLTEIRDALKKP